MFSLMTIIVTKTVFAIVASLVLFIISLYLYCITFMIKNKILYGYTNYYSLGILYRKFNQPLKNHSEFINVISEDEYKDYLSGYRNRNVKPKA